MHTILVNGSNDSLRLLYGFNNSKPKISQTLKKNMNFTSFLNFDNLIVITIVSRASRHWIIPGYFCELVFQNCAHLYVLLFTKLKRMITFLLCSFFFSSDRDTLKPKRITFHIPEIHKMTEMIQSQFLNSTEVTNIKCDTIKGNESHVGNVQFLVWNIIYLSI